MDGARFDRLSRAFGQGVTRRSTLAAFAALVAGGMADADARRRHRKQTPHSSQKHRPNDDSRKVEICHQTNSASNPWVRIEVSRNALDTHLAHGDFVYGECCAASDCKPDQTCQHGGDDKSACVCDRVACGSHGGCCADGACRTDNDENFCGSDGQTCRVCCAKAGQTCASGQCRTPCGDDKACDAATEVCCQGSCVANTTCCTVGHVGPCLPNTNDYNRDHNLPHVDLVDQGNETITLKFFNSTNSQTFFEYRIDGDKLTCGTPHPVIIGDFIYHGVCLDNRPAPEAGCHAGSEWTETFTAKNTVEIRLALGGERDWDFDSGNPQGWVTFDVG